MYDRDGGTGTSEADLTPPPDFQTLHHPCMIQSKVWKSSFAQISNVDQISYCKNLYSHANKTNSTKEFQSVSDVIFSKQSKFFEMLKSFDADSMV